MHLITIPFHLVCFSPEFLLGTSGKTDGKVYLKKKAAILLLTKTRRRESSDEDTNKFRSGGEIGS